ncbi:hypothetical protein [Ktedonospora formicarum]|uniref:Uncharacterized protein n=1 Tax=Ktedonospora formicarum TaxID=2778364 RepID=A0A8J3MWR7_9CHLR|nr:hypothetical protein [Ktedonospora formicarum]GHO50635.1 hypothetical protein KSX_87980 [Ktedonospora formicarum]
MATSYHTDHTPLTLHIPLPDGRSCILTAEQALSFLAWFHEYSETLSQTLEVWLRNDFPPVNIDEYEETTLSAHCEFPSPESDLDLRLLQPYVLTQYIDDTYYIVDSGQAFMPDDLNEDQSLH